MTDQAEMQERLINIATNLGADATIEALQAWRDWDKIQQSAVDCAIHEGDVVDGDDHRTEVAKLNREMDELVRDDVAFQDDAERLHEAICSGDRQSAIDILNDMAGIRLRSIAEQRNLFPDRVPA